MKLSSGPGFQADFPAQGEGETGRLWCWFVGIGLTGSLRVSRTPGRILLLSGSGLLWGHRQWEADKRAPIKELGSKTD